MAAAFAGFPPVLAGAVQATVATDKKTLMDVKRATGDGVHNLEKTGRKLRGQCDAWRQKSTCSRGLQS
eukprot:3438455-Amphidinium_carterae.2